MTETLEAKQIAKDAENGESVSFNIQEISELLPHKYPFLMVDRVTDCKPGIYAKAYKNISMNEPQFQGHFPNAPIMPGVLQIEALAQACCLCILAIPEYKDGYTGIFTGLDSVKFRKMVVPGDRLELDVTRTKFRFPYGKFEVKASVDGEDTCSAMLSFVMVKNEEL
ncbi:MAG: 3-hydroxyacyl-ACP dehydratase FabZ [Candidatus Caenarcaniphilales bacterium]|nr:3-hydroxyacyl-ACP dehydratase FabZ [Candidatus Caenarcaniphilales bacterium]